MLFAYVTATNNDDQDIYIFKLDGSGNFIWVKTIGVVGADYGYGIDLDPTRDVYVTGSFKQTIDFDPGTGIYNERTHGNSDLFLLQLDRCGYCSGQGR